MNLAADWLGNSFNQVVVANFASCTECGAAAGAPCHGADVVGTYAHSARVADGMVELHAELQSRVGWQP